MQNGHYIGRTKFGTRWDEMNCHVQCQYCNENLGGNLKVYKQFMIQTYGENAVEELMVRARQADKLSLSELENLTLIYKEKVKKYLTPQ